MADQAIRKPYEQEPYPTRLAGLDSGEPSP